MMEEDMERMQASVAFSQRKGANGGELRVEVDTHRTADAFDAARIKASLLSAHPQKSLSELLERFKREGLGSLAEALANLVHVANRYEHLGLRGQHIIGFDADPRKTLVFTLTFDGSPTCEGLCRMCEIGQHQDCRDSRCACTHPKRGERQVHRRLKL